MYNLNGIDSKFRLAILVARRAKQLIGGAKKKIDIKAENVLTIAMEEFKQGKTDFDVLTQQPTLIDEENLEQEDEAAVENNGEFEEDSEVTDKKIQPQPEA